MSRIAVGLFGGLTMFVALAIWARPIGDPPLCGRDDVLGAGVDRLLATLGPPSAIAEGSHDSMRWSWPCRDGGLATLTVHQDTVVGVDADFAIDAIERRDLPATGAYLGKRVPDVARSGSSATILHDASVEGDRGQIVAAVHAVRDGGATVVDDDRGDRLTIRGGRVVAIERVPEPVAGQRAR